MTVVYDDGQVTLLCGDVRRVDLPGGSAAAVVTSPPYNVGVAYHGVSDALAWPAYWSLAYRAAEVMAGVLVPGGRVWVNTAVSVPEDQAEGGPHSQRTTKRRVMLAHRWASILERAGLALVDQVAWCSPRGAGTAWGSWASPAAPNLRGDWEAVTVACRGGWERTPPEGYDGGTVWAAGRHCARPCGTSPPPAVSQAAIRRRSRSSWPAGASASPPGRARRCSTPSPAPVPPCWPPASSAGGPSASRPQPRTATWPPAGWRRAWPAEARPVDEDAEGWPW